MPEQAEETTTRKPGIPRLIAFGSTTTGFPSKRRLHAAVHKVGIAAERHATSATKPTHWTAIPNKSPHRKAGRLLAYHRAQNEAGISARAPLATAPIASIARRASQASTLDGLVTRVRAGTEPISARLNARLASSHNDQVRRPRDGAWSARSASMRKEFQLRKIAIAAHANAT